MTHYSQAMKLSTKAPGAEGDAGELTDPLRRALVMAGG